MPGDPSLSVRIRLFAAAGLAGAVLLAGCAGSAGPVSVTLPAPAGAARARCDALAKALPTTVGSQAARTTTPASPLAAAWGSDPIVLRCGVAEPAEMVTDPTADAVWINGVSWLFQLYTGGVRYFTTDRSLYVEVTVPNDFDPGHPNAAPTDPLVDLAPAVLHAIPNKDGTFRPDTPQ
jgi:hypothetical protein